MPSRGGGGPHSGIAANEPSKFLQVALKLPWAVEMVTLVPSVLPLQASKASWGGLLRSPRGGLLVSLSAQQSTGIMVVNRQRLTIRFL